MKIQSELNNKGLTLIELLVAFVISALIIGGIYRLFITQTKAYTTQDQAAEVQQGTRGAMEILLRDLKMAGFDDDNINSLITITNPIVYPVAQNSITVNYEHYNVTTLQYELHTVAYGLNVGTSNTVELFRQQTINGVAPSEVLLENVDALNFRYGLDANEDGFIDNWVDAAAVGATKVIALHVLLRARPDQTNPDVQRMVSPRTLESTVILRNQCLVR